MNKRLSIILLSSILTLFLSNSGFAECRPDEPSSQKSPDANALNILDNKFTSVDLFGVMQVRYQNYGPKIAVERRIVSLPFLQTLFMLNYPDVNSVKRPSKQLMMVDWPIICISGELYLGNRHYDPNMPYQQIDTKQHRILDTLIFCAYDHETWGKEQSFTEFGRLPLLATCYQHERTIERETTRIADIHILAAFIQEKTDCAKNSELLRLPFIGPLWAKWSVEEKESHSSILPGLICHKSYKQLKKNLNNTGNCEQKAGKHLVTNQ